MGTEQELRDYLRRAAADLTDTRRRVHELENAQHEPVAVVGMSCRFPGGSTSPEHYWQMLRARRDCSGPIPPSRWDADAYYDERRGIPGRAYTSKGAFLDDVTSWDAGFFGSSPAEALRVDPHQRLLMELGWECFDDAGLPVDRVAKTKAGVFVGLMDTQQYGRLQYEHGGAEVASDPHFGQGATANVAAGRLAYHFDLRGPTMTIDTACSSSMVAMHLAMRALRNGECDLALVGGVYLILDPDTYVQACATYQLSQNGRCRTFDTAADGYVMGEGAGMVMLERHSDAIANSRRVHAVLRGSAVNQDGKSNGLTAPNRSAQVAVIQAALDDARTSTDQIDYLETHGSATALGDSIELSALYDVFGNREATQPLHLGAVKTNIGHTQSAAGIASVIKAIQVLKHSELPPSLGLEQPIDALDVEGPLQPATQTVRLDSAATRVAGVSGFGWSGTNVHLVLESAPSPPTGSDQGGSTRDNAQLIPVSGATSNALAAQRASYAEWLTSSPVDLADAAHTLARGRTHLDHRSAVVAEHLDDAVNALSHHGYGHRVHSRPTTALLFPGVGDQYAALGRQLYDTDPTYAAVVDDCLDRLQANCNLDLRAYMFDRDTRGDEVDPFGNLKAAHQGSGGPHELHPSLFIIEYALATWLISHGVRVDAVIGYSLGEYVAACVAGVFDLDDALRVVVERSRLIASVEPGGMLAIAGDERATRAAIAHSGAQVDIAALNGPSMTVVSGVGPEVERLTAHLREHEVPHQPVQSEVAFHSTLLTPVRDALRDVLEQVSLQAPTCPVYGNVTGKQLSDEEATSSEYWADHLVSPIRFGSAVESCLRDGIDVFVDVGPGQALGGIIHRDFSDTRSCVVPTLAARHQSADGPTERARMLQCLGRLWECGLAIDWAQVHPGDRPPVSAPPYAFQRTRFWPHGETTPTPKTAAVSILTPSWHMDEDSGAALPDEAWPGTVVLLGGHDALVAALTDELDERGVALSQADRSDHDDTSPVVIIDLRWLDLDYEADPEIGVIPVARTVDEWLGGRPGDTSLVIATAGAYRVRPDESAVPAQAALPAVARVAGQEYPHARVCSVDLDPQAEPAAIATALMHEVTRDAGGQDVAAYRDGARHHRRFDEAESTDGGPRIREGGAYLITGGLGDVGQQVAEHLARDGARRVVLTSRREVSEHAVIDRLSELGVHARIATADVTDRAAMRSVVADVVAEAGRIDGVIHAATASASDAFTMLRDLDDNGVRAHFGAKVHGAQVLSAVLDELDFDQRPDFRLAFSSTSAVLGGLAFGSYAAANAALTAVCVDSDGPAWTSVEWDTWEATADLSGSEVGASMRAHTMSRADALGAFDSALALGGGNYVVAAGGFEDRLYPAVSAGVAAAARTRYSRPELPQPYVAPINRRERDLAEVWSEVVGVEPVGTQDNFFDLGGNSLLALQMLTLIKTRFNATIAAVELFEAPTVKALASRLPSTEGSTSRPAAAEPTRAARPIVPSRSGHSDSDSQIAVIGMAGRFPGAPDVDTFWRNICDGVESIRFFSREELIDAGVDPAEADDPSYVPARPVLDGVGDFDAGFFGMSPRMAALTDPQQRLFLESCWEALEHSGYAASDPRRGRVGVYGGMNLSTYLLQMPPESIYGGDVSTSEIIMGNEKDALTTIVSYLLDLQGPSVAVQTFCSTSLVATHLAVQALRAGECELALAGGVSVQVPCNVGYRYTPGGQESPDGHVRTFDARAGGSLFGDGAAVVVLKRLSDAVRDGDEIWSVVRGTAMNNDGALKVGYTAPSVVGQADVVSAALEDAGVDSRDIGYVEAHGTATELGDPIEVAALTRAFGHVDDPQQCLIGSVKTNVGHLDRAAGVTGLIKTSLALRHQVIPPTIHYTKPNPEIDFEHGPFHVVAKTTAWPTRDDKPAFAGINSLGMGGTNVHAVVERGPERKPRPNPDDDGRRFHVLPISARTEPAVEQWTTDLVEHLIQHPDLCLADVAYTLQAGRKRFEHRRFTVASSISGATDALSGGLDHTVETAIGRPVAYWLAGLDRELVRPGALCELIRREPDVRTEWDEVLGSIQETDAAVQSLSDDSDEGGFSDTAVAQFVAEIVLARVLQRWGVAPSFLVAHGIGEYVAGCLSGALTVGEATIALRYWATLHELSVEARRESFTSWLRSNVKLEQPRSAWISATSGVEVDSTVVVDPAYWAHVLDSAETPAKGLEWLCEEPGIAVVEIGSDRLDDALAAQSGATVPTAALMSRAHKRPDDEVLTTALGRLWSYGVDIDWESVHGRGTIADQAGHRAHRIPLPTYPFQRQTYWLAGDPKARATEKGAAADGAVDQEVTLESIADLERLSEDEWFFQESWRQESAPTASPASGVWLFYTCEGAATDVVERFRRANPDAIVHRVFPGAEFHRDGADFTIRQGHLEDTTAMVRALRADGDEVDHVVHLWALEPGMDEVLLASGLHALVALVRAMAEVGWSTWTLDVVAPGTQRVLPGDVTNPMGAVLTGPCRVVSLEHPQVRARLLDIDQTPTAWSVQAVAHELTVSPTDPTPVVALRHQCRWVPEYTSMAPTPVQAVPWRTGGVYLITGGLGGIGLAMAERAVRDYEAKVVLLSRGHSPSKAEWPASLNGVAEVVTGDVSNPADVRRAVDRAIECFGALHGVIHAAGVPGEGLIQLKSPKDVDVVLAPKVGGSLALAEALNFGKPDEVVLDFVVLFSSVSSTTGGGPGQVDYCSANAYLDAFAAAYNSADRRVVAINWGEWAWNAWDSGLAGYDEELQRFFRTNRARIGIDYEAGWRAMTTVLCTDAPRVVVCSQDFPTIVQHSSEFTIETVGQVGADSTERHPRPDLVTAYQEPKGDDEEALAQIWQQALRLETVGVHDNYFELGGNSLLGVTIVNALQRHFNEPDLPPHVLYEAPTIVALVERIRAGASGGESSASEKNHARAQLRRSGVHTAAARRRQPAEQPSEGHEE